MIDKTLYENYCIGFRENYETDEESYYFIYNDDRDLFLVDDCVPNSLEGIGFEFNFRLYIGEYKGKAAFVLK